MPRGDGGSGQDKILICHNPGANNEKFREVGLDDLADHALHGDWKVVAKGGKRSHWELYNLKQDPLELKNLAESMPEKLKKLVSIWKTESSRHARPAKLQ